MVPDNRRAPLAGGAPLENVDFSGFVFLRVNPPNRKKQAPLLGPGDNLPLEFGPAKMPIVCRHWFGDESFSPNSQHDLKLIQLPPARRARS